MPEKRTAEAVPPAAGRRRQLRREGIRDAAVQLFAELGYDRTGLKDIAEVVGVTHPALYYYYRSKDEILFDVVESTMSSLIAGLREVLKSLRGQSPRERLLAMATHQVLSQLQVRGMTPLADSVLYGPLCREDVLDAAQRATLVRLQRELVSLYRKEVEAGVKAGLFSTANVAAATFTLLGAVSYVVYWFREDGPQTREEVAAMVARMAVGSLQDGHG